MFAPYITQALLGSPRFRAVQASLRSPTSTKESSARRGTHTRKKLLRRNKRDCHAPARLLSASSPVTLPVPHHTALERRLKESSNTALDVLKLLHPPNPRPHFDILDGTIGLGGTARALLEEAIPSRVRQDERYRDLIRVVGLDVDYTLEDTPEIQHLVRAHTRRCFRFIPSRISAALSLFGENSFDGVVVHLGANERQLLDPARGFNLWAPFPSKCSMTYAPNDRVPIGAAIQYLNTANYDSLMNMLVDVAALPYPLANPLANRILRSQGNIFSNQGVLGIFSSMLSGPRRRGHKNSDVETVHPHPSTAGTTCTPWVSTGEGWTELTHAQPVEHLACALHALRTAVNYEEQEFRAVLGVVGDLLRPGSRCAIVCSAPWMEVECAALEKQHPLLFAPVFPQPMHPRSEGNGSWRKVRRPPVLWVLEKSTDPKVPVFDKKIGNVWYRSRPSLNDAVSKEMMMDLDAAAAVEDNTDINDYRFAIGLDDYTFESKMVQKGLGVYNKKL